MGDVKIKIADDGEILLKTQSIFTEYFNHRKKTKDAFQDGWMYTGDIGLITQEGYLKITGRKKDIIITSGGKNISPQKIENLLRAKEYITHPIIIGNQRPYLIALISIEKQDFSKHLKSYRLAKDCSAKSIAQHKKVKELIQKQIDDVNKKLAKFETIKKFFIIPETLTTDNFLTAKMSVKKYSLEKFYEKEINALYNE